MSTSPRRKPSQAAVELAPQRVRGRIRPAGFRPRRRRRIRGGEKIRQDAYRIGDIDLAGVLAVGRVGAARRAVAEEEIAEDSDRVGEVEPGIARRESVLSNTPEMACPIWSNGCRASVTAVETLLEHGCQVLAVNPKQLDRFRLAAHQVDDPLVIKIREWSRMHEGLGQEKVRPTNRLREQLRRYFPQYLELAPDVSRDDWLLEVWKRIPTPAEAKRGG